MSSKSEQQIEKLMAKMDARMEAGAKMWERLYKERARFERAIEEMKQAGLWERYCAETGGSEDVDFGDLGA